MIESLLPKSSKAYLLLYCFIFAFATSLLLFNLVHDYEISRVFGYYIRPSTPWHFDPQQDARNYGLTEEQCDIAFHGLFWQIDDAVSRRRPNLITRDELERQSWPPGTVRIMIWNEQLYVIDAVRPGLRRSRVYSTLHAINRAIKSSTDYKRLPNIEAVISIEDFTVDKDRPIWAYDKLREDRTTWLMPDFGFYSWPEPGIGAYTQVRKRIEDVESTFSSLSDKIQKLVWRGAISGVLNRPLRESLINVTANQPWADVKELIWQKHDDADRHRIPIEDHCKYAFVLNTEGRAWSGRLKYIQNCRSVILFHDPKWFQHHQHLMQHRGPYQNYVKVRRDFSDLQDKMQYLLSHPEDAHRIAQNSVDLFRDRNLTPAAEACYWRKLIRGGASVSFNPDFYTGLGPGRQWRGVPFEDFTLVRKLKWDPS